jgi:uncharacterized protein
VQNAPESVLDAHLDRLRRWFAPHGSALVAYSGGVDSALVAVAASRALEGHTVACIGVSPSYPARELRDAIALAEQAGVRYRLVATDEYLDPAYAANPVNRCYHCKTHLYDRLSEIAAEERWGVVLDGTHADDLGDSRPGRAAAIEHGVRSPLAELGFGKPVVRALARQFGLPAWNKPAMACLSSRVPHGVSITSEMLSLIERAEDVLAALGFRQFRVRHHGELARVELPPEDFDRAMTDRARIVDGIRAVGYRHVCLDLAGFRGGTAEADVAPLVVRRRSE